MNSICNQGDAAKENISFVKEIQMMMFGLGDSANPLLTTATVVEKIVLQQIIMIVGQAEDIAETRGVDGIYPQDILFLMRKDIHKLQRINYWKDLTHTATEPPEQLRSSFERLPRPLITGVSSALYHARQLCLSDHLLTNCCALGTSSPPSLKFFFYVYNVSQHQHCTSHIEARLPNLPYWGKWIAIEFLVPPFPHHRHQT
ncbi:Transcription initiation protein SPT3 [Homalodisca vitripennis]|nr:Transcription initiation protein SPT3 [Homalodisca vitripennis]